MWKAYSAETTRDRKNKENPYGYGTWNPYVVDHGHSKTAA